MPRRKPAPNARTPGKSKRAAVADPDAARDDPGAVVAAFAAAHNAWERGMARADHPFSDRKLKAEFQRVLTTYCTLRRRVYVSGSSYGTPLAYEGIDPEAITAVRRVKPGRVHVHVPGDAFEYLFVVFKKRDGWRIDSRKYRTRGKRVWDNKLL